MIVYELSFKGVCTVLDKAIYLVEAIPFTKSRSF